MGYISNVPEPTNVLSFQKTGIWITQDTAYEFYFFSSVDRVLSCDCISKRDQIGTESPCAHQ